jgi:beta-lactamase class A
LLVISIFTLTPSIFTLRGRMHKNVSWPLTAVLASTSIFVAPAQSAQLIDWGFSTERNVIRLNTDTSVKPTVFLLSNPNRLVIDLPGTEKKGPTIRNQYGGAIREIRISEVSGNVTRAVIELSSGFGVSSRNIKVVSDAPGRWYVRMKSIENGIPPGPGETKEVIQVPTEGAAESPLPPPIGAPTSSKPLPSGGNVLAANLPRGKEIAPLKSQLQSLISRYSNLSPGMFFIDVETGDYVNLGGDRVYAAASTIKLPILMAFFEAVDAGRIDLDEKLTVTNASITGGSGNLQYYPGAKVSALTTATKMITISDNTATNMIVSRLGGLAAVNARFRSWGLSNTYMKNYLGDFKGTNKTTAVDLVKASALVAKRKVMSESSRAKALDILNATENTKLLKAGLGDGANIAHKTGTLGVILGDAGIIEKPSGKLYLAGVFVRRPFNDLRGRYFIQEASRISYNYFNSRG